MVIAKLEQSGNIAKLYLKTHFNTEYEFNFEKTDNEIFRLSGTAINSVDSYEGILLDHKIGKFKAFKSELEFLDDIGILSPENWIDISDRHCFITELYSLDMERCWIITKNPIKDANHLFINVDLCDGALNLIKRYRISPFWGTQKIING